MTKPALTVGQALVQLLADYGIDVVFGIPGTHSLELYRGLAASPIRHISPRHEQGGGFMADGYARTVGKPAACFVITGPGATNISTPLGEAYLDFVPMLVISPVNPPDPDNINRGRLHEITHQQAATAPFCAFSATVSQADELPALVHRAFALFASGPPRPVHLHIPLPILPLPVDAPWRAQPLPAPPAVGAAQIEPILALLKQAKNPVIVAGGGCVRCADQVVALGEKLACPLLTTVAGRGIVPPQHRLGVGAQLRAPYVQALLSEADLALFLGTNFAPTEHWNDDLVLPKQQVWINLEPTVFDRPPARRANRYTLQAEVGACVRLLLAADTPRSAGLAAAVDACAAARRQHPGAMTIKQRGHWQVLGEICRGLPDDSVVTSDMTQLAYTAVGYLPWKQAGRWHHPTGYGTLGYALPAAIGAAVAKPGTPVMAIIGDAGLQYSLQEMGLAKELQLNLTVLLWNNHALQQIYDDMRDADIEPIGVVQENPDFVQLGRAYRWRVEQIDAVAQLADRLRRSFEQPGPTLLLLDETTCRPLSPP